MTTEKAATKKTTAKKTTAKKTTAKKASATKQEKEKKALEKVAQETLDGKWGSGRERDIMLRDAGFDPMAVQVTRARLRANSSN